MIRGPRLLLLVFALVALSGCAQVRGSISAETLNAPVSLTNSVYDATGRVLTLEEDLEVVGRFDTTTRFASAFYGLAPPTWTWDASEFLNRQLSLYGGEAIVGLRVSTEEPNGGEVLYAFLSQVLPVAPIWVKVRLAGEVVRRRSSDQGR